jgi:hypothetical protein
VIANREIPSKASEAPEMAPMLRELNEYFPLAGHVLAADALHGQDDFAELARGELGGHYVLTVKKIRRNLLTGLCRKVGLDDIAATIREAQYDKDLVAALTRLTTAP